MVPKADGFLYYAADGATLTASVFLGFPGKVKVSDFCSADLLAIFFRLLLCRKIFVGLLDKNARNTLCPFGRR